MTPEKKKKSSDAKIFSSPSLFFLSSHRLLSSILVSPPLASSPFPLRIRLPSLYLPPLSLSIPLFFFRSLSFSSLSLISFPLSLTSSSSLFSIPLPHIFLPSPPASSAPRMVHTGVPHHAAILAPNFANYELKRSSEAADARMTQELPREGDRHCHKRVSRKKKYI